MARKLFRNPEAPTGLSLASGSPVAGPGDLPDHRVEIHVFKDGDTAVAFMAGLELAGNPNSLAWSHEPGDESANRTVLVARLDEPRPEGATLDECLPVRSHARTDHDLHAREAAMRRLQAERSEAYARERAITEPLREALRAAGIRVEDPGNGWVRTDLATFEMTPSGIQAEFEDLDDHGDPEPIRARSDEAAAAAGFRRTDAMREYAGGPYPGPAEAVAAHAAFAVLCAAIAEIRKDEHQKSFMARMRVTPARRRFLTAAAEAGISLSTRRNHLEARAGGNVAKATEFGELKRAGWIRQVDRFTAEVTTEGLEAAGLAAAAPRP